MTAFTDLGLTPARTDALAAKGYQTPTPIQAQAIPPILAGRDLLGIAQTGTGKTAAFMLPALDRLVAAGKGRPQPGKARMLVLAPTRELASQIADQARHYAKGDHVSVGVVFGGVPVPRSIREVSRGLDVLVATPGRLLDLIDQRVLSLSSLEILVLDEADQMLDLGFIHDLKRIVRMLPEKRQTLFFSATMPANIRQLADRFCQDPVQVAVTPVATTAERIEQRITFVNQAEKTALLIRFFEETTIDRALVFSRTKHGADKIVRYLAAAGIEAHAIHGNKSQANREKAIAMFKSGEVPILVATDIAARGIDIPGVSHVLNYDLPNVPEQYVHRIGRTARAGADGIALGFCSEEERPYLKDIEKLIRQKIAIQPLPPGFLDTVAAVAALKPAPRHGGRGGTDHGHDVRADRRADGRQRDNRNSRRKPKPVEGVTVRDERPAGAKRRRSRGRRGQGGQGGGVRAPGWRPGAPQRGARPRPPAEGGRGQGGQGGGARAQA